MEHSFGHWLQRRRKALDLTQEELARRVGCAAETLRKIEADARRPSRQIAERWCSGTGSRRVLCARGIVHYYRRSDR